MAVLLHIPTLCEVQKPEYGSPDSTWQVELIVNFAYLGIISASNFFLINKLSCKLLHMHTYDFVSCTEEMPYLKQLLGK